MSRVRVTVVLAMLLAAAGCAGNSRSGVLPPPGNGEPEIRVENASAVNLQIYASSHGIEQLMGRVDGMRTGVFPLPVGMTGAIRLIARLNANRTSDRQHSSEPFTVQTGQYVEWRLRASPGEVMPRLSTISIFNCTEPADC